MSESKAALCVSQALDQIAQAKERLRVHPSNVLAWHEYRTAAARLMEAASFADRAAHYVENAPVELDYEQRGTE